MNLKEQYKTSQWQQRKAEIMLRDKFKCKCCGSTQDLLVHHLEYPSNGYVWLSPSEDMVTVCSSCHKIVNDRVKESRRSIVPDDVLDEIGHTPGPKKVELTMPEREPLIAEKVERGPKVSAAVQLEYAKWSITPMRLNVLKTLEAMGGTTTMDAMKAYLRNVGENPANVQALKVLDKMGYVKKVKRGVYRINEEKRSDWSNGNGNGKIYPDPPDPTFAAAPLNPEKITATQANIMNLEGQMSCPHCGNKFRVQILKINGK